ncbi:MAG: hypothetical protein A3J39_06510 [Sulfuricurvum sp. RIFCSPHIGHO2_12_FULL_44_8]|nr:MAG: hypothetical protein A3J39_06510 [Sulfuricurvum sp. RIFCSPHIGHO2_12_FULL_44_8]
MPADFQRIQYRLPKFSRSTYGTLMHTLETALGFGASEKAQFRLHCIEFLVNRRWQAFHEAFPHISRATVFRWKQRFGASGRRLNTLVPCSTRPHRTRQMVLPPPVLGFLKAMREQHPHLSKYKLKSFVDAWCREQGHPSHSISWIGKVLKRHQLFFGQRQRVYKRRRQSRHGYTIRRTPNPNTVALGYLQLDGVKVYWSGEKVVFLTALELKTRTAWVRVVPTVSSVHAKHFLQDILDAIPYAIHTIHTDNGSEFHALFDKAVADLGLTHLWSPPRSPKIHSHIERFNGVLQEEFVDYHIDMAVIEPLVFQSKLTAWLLWYNTMRPHHGLQLMTPSQYLLHLQKGEKSLKCM